KGRIVHTVRAIPMRSRFSAVDKPLISTVPALPVADLQQAAPSPALLPRGQHSFHWISMDISKLFRALPCAPNCRGELEQNDHAEPDLSGGNKTKPGFLPGFD